MTKRRTVEPIEADRLAMRKFYAWINRTMPADRATTRATRVAAIRHCVSAFNECENLDVLYATRTLPPMPAFGYSPTHRPLPTKAEIQAHRARLFGKRKG